MSPALSIPVGIEGKDFTLGGGSDFTASFFMPFLRNLSLELHTGYTLLPLNAGGKGPFSLSLIPAAAGAGVSFQLFQNFFLTFHAEGGYFLTFFNDEISTLGGNGYFGTGLRVYYKLLPSFSVGAEAKNRNYIGLYYDISVSLSAAFHFGAVEGRSVLLKPADGEKKTGLFRQVPVLPLAHTPAESLFVIPYAVDPASKKGPSAIREMFVTIEPLSGPETGTNRRLELITKDTVSVIKMPPGDYRIAAAEIVKKGEGYLSKNIIENFPIDKTVSIGERQIYLFDWKCTVKNDGNESRLTLSEFANEQEKTEIVNALQEDPRWVGWERYELVNFPE
jgi:hypothetical protein